MNASTKLSSLVAPVESREPAAAETGPTFIYIDLSAVSQDSKTITGARDVDVADAPSRARQVVASGDVLVSTVRPNLNAVAMVGAELAGATASTGFCVLRPIQGRLDSRYLLQWVKTPAFVTRLTRLATGASYPAVTERTVLESEILLPPPAEQRRIADILDRADAIRTKRREAIALLESLRGASYHDLFGDPRANPRGWPVARLGNLIENGPQNGLYKPSTDYGSGTLILRIDGFYDGRVNDIQGLKRVRVGDRERELYALSEGELVMNRVNSREYLGKSALVPALSEPVLFESNMMRFAVDRSRVAPDYVVAFLQTTFAKSQILGAAKDAINQSSVNQQDVKRLSLPVPPLERQHEFVRRVATIARLEAAHQASLTEMDALFASLQHRAFRGEL